MKRRAKIVLVLVLVLLLGIWFLIHGSGSSRRAVETYKRDLLVKGERLTMTELAPATNDPLPAKTFMDLMSSPAPTNLPYPMKTIAPGAVARFNAFLKPDQMSSYEQNVRRVADLAKIFGTNGLRFNVDYTRTNYSLSHLPKLRAAELLVVGTFLQALATNDQREAQSDLLIAVNMVHPFEDGHTVTSELYHFAQCNFAAAATWEALQSDKWSSPQLAELQARWQSVSAISNIGSVIRMERAEGIAGLAELRRTNEDAYLFLGTLTRNSTSSANSSSDSLIGGIRDEAKELYNHYPVYWKWRAGWSYDEELVMLQLFEADLKLSESVTRAGAFVPALKTRDKSVADILAAHSGEREHFRLLGGDFDVEETFLLKAAEDETFRRLAVTAIALKRCQLDRGSYPNDLNSLVPAYLSQVPLDFMDGKPLRYRLNSDGTFLLYSVGEDGEDNGGDPSVSGLSSWLKGRDIVWPRAATPKEVEDYLKAQNQKSGSANQ